MRGIFRILALTAIVAGAGLPGEAKAYNLATALAGPQVAVVKMANGSIRVTSTQPQDVEPAAGLQD